MRDRSIFHRIYSALALHDEYWRHKGCLPGALPCSYRATLWGLDRDDKLCSESSPSPSDCSSSSSDDSSVQYQYFVFFFRLRPCKYSTSGEGDEGVCSLTDVGSCGDASISAAQPLSRVVVRVRLWQGLQDVLYCQQDGVMKRLFPANWIIRSKLAFQS